MKKAFRTVAVFTYPSEALILEGRLEADGIPVFLRDQMTIYTDPMVSNAIGGVKMDVYTEDFVRAEAIAMKLHPELFKHIIECPHCNSRNTFSRATPLNLFKKLFPFFNSLDHQCRNCDTKFTK